MSHRRSCHHAATRRALRDALPPLRTPSSSVHTLRADAGSSRSSSRPVSDRVRVRDCRTRASTGYRTALPRRPGQTDCITAAGSRCATSRRSETLDGRLEDPPSDNAARSLLPALTTAPPRPSRLETRRAWCASSCPHNPASRSSVARPYCRPRIKAAVCHDPEVDQRFPKKQTRSRAEQTRQSADRLTHPLLEKLGPIPAAQAELFAYSVKVVCGKQTETNCCCVAGARPGVYATEVNIQNLNLVRAPVVKFVQPLINSGAVVAREPNFADPTTLAKRQIEQIILPPLG